MTPVSQLTKWHNAIAYHKYREEVAAGASHLACGSGKENCHDVYTPPLGARIKM